MKRVRWFLSTHASDLAICGLICFAQAINVLHYDPPPPVRAKIGKQGRGQVPLSLQEGYHVNSNTPSDEYLIPLQLTWSKGALEPAEVVYPKPRMEKYQFSSRQAALGVLGKL